jgi:hypothetical protein
MYLGSSFLRDQNPHVPRVKMIPMRPTNLDRQWEELIALCAKEQEFTREHRHPKLLMFLSSQINQLARQLGFREHQIQRREFRAVKEDGHVVRLLIE